MSYCPECNSLHFEDDSSHFVSRFDGEEVSRFDGDSADNAAHFFGNWDHTYLRGGGVYSDQGGIYSGPGKNPPKKPPQKTMRAYFDGLAPQNRSRRSRFYAEPISAPQESFLDAITNTGNAVAAAWHKVWN
jgi:hypothetical protein